MVLGDVVVEHLLSSYKRYEKWKKKEEKIFKQATRVLRVHSPKQDVTLCVYIPAVVEWMRFSGWRCNEWKVRSISKHRKRWEMVHLILVFLVFSTLPMRVVAVDDWDVMLFTLQRESVVSLSLLYLSGCVSISLHLVERRRDIYVNLRKESTLLMHLQ